MKFTDDRLKGLAFQVANMAKTDLRIRHKINGVLAMYQEGHGLTRLRKIEKFMEETAGEGWLDSGRAKDIIFGVIRASTGVILPDAIVVSTAIDNYVPTPAFLALPAEEQERIMDEQYARKYPQYFKPHDALMAIAQTPERACIYRQRFEHGLLVGEPVVHFLPQEQFGGRLKFYGAEPDPEIVEALARMMKEREEPN